MEIVEEAGGVIYTPPMACEYLYSWLLGTGICMVGAAGVVPLTACELQAWQAGTGKALEPWEFQALLEASRAYCSENNSASEIPPYGGTDELVDEDVLARKLEMTLDKLL